MRHGERIKARYRFGPSFTIDDKNLARLVCGFTIASGPSSAADVRQAQSFDNSAIDDPIAFIQESCIHDDLGWIKWGAEIDMICAKYWAHTPEIAGKNVYQRITPAFAFGSTGPLGAQFQL